MENTHDIVFMKDLPSEVSRLKRVLEERLKTPVALIGNGEDFKRIIF
ncbi:hypothetical protein J4476_01345 [Candidatus Woesearchaeota archaeon]|nr:MAG: hypothetical protein QT09_C0006G0061 [archaeon GW2011_AR18]MBS3161323.1 hypothetical protein [Candidatus Woesearchaeota archaeon]HIH26278.1 hypothetical protein [Nanoarchaeota archaeon]